MTDTLTADQPTPAQSTTEKPSLIGMSRDRLAAALVAVGVPAGQAGWRVPQLWHWLSSRGAPDFAAMTNVPKALRATRAANYSLPRPEIVAEQVSADGTIKWLLRFPPRGAGRPVEIETVYIPEE